MAKKKKSTSEINPNYPGRHSLGFQMWEASNAWQRSMRAALQPLSITHVQYLLLSTMLVYAEENDGSAIQQTQLVRLAGTDKMMTSKVVRTLEERKLLTRSVVNNDLRSLKLELTQDGILLTRQAAIHVKQVEDTFFLPVVQKADKLSKMLLSLSDGDLDAE